MGTLFPAALDQLTNPTSGTSQQALSHAAQHANENDAIEAMQAFILGGSGALVIATAAPYLADKTGITDAVGPLNAANATGLPVYLPQGTYRLTTNVTGNFIVASGTTFTGAGTLTGTGSYFLLRNDLASIANGKGGGLVKLTDGRTLQQFATQIQPLANAVAVREDTPFPHVGLGNAAVPENLFLLRTTGSRDGTTITSSAQLQRIYNANHPTALTKNLTVASQVGVDAMNPVTVGLAWGVSAEMYIRPGATVTGDVTASSAVIQKFSAAANAIAFHGQVRDYITYALDGSNVTPSVGLEINAPVTGADSVSANDGFGNRILVTLFARTNNDTANGASGTLGETGCGLFLSNFGPTSGIDTQGYFRNAIGITDTGAGTPITVGIKIVTRGQYAAWIRGVHTIADILCDGNSQNGLVLNGTYSDNALRIATGQGLALDTAGTVRFVFNGSNKVQLTVGGVARGYFDLAAADHAF